MKTWSYYSMIYTDIIFQHNKVLESLENYKEIENKCDSAYQNQFRAVFWKINIAYISEILCENYENITVLYTLFFTYCTVNYW